MRKRETRRVKAYRKSLSKEKKEEIKKKDRERKAKERKLPRKIIQCYCCSATGRTIFANP